MTGRAVHGRLKLSVTGFDTEGETSLSATVGNVVSPSRSDERQVSHWSLKNNGDQVELQRKGFDERSPYEVIVSGRKQDPKSISWRGLVPRDAENLAEWIPARLGALETWASHVRHLQCPRQLLPSPFSMREHSSLRLGSRGENTPLALAADDALRESVREWYRKAFGVSIDIATQGSYFELVARAPMQEVNVLLEQSGRGLSHVLPVVATALTAGRAGAGVDVIEHPEAELHPAAHGEVAELLLENLAGSDRPLIIETHSEMVVLRTRRWIAEGRLPASNVLIYWIYSEPGQGSRIRKIRIDENGALDKWPEDVFIEDYEEIMAIRRAVRDKA